MTSEDVQAVVAQALAAWQVPVVESGSTHGIPWTAERYAPMLERLRASLVAPFRQRFELAEYDERRHLAEKAEYWVVAVTEEIYLWYEEATGDFGVGERTSDGTLPRSIGLRGDIVGSFCAW
jgi:hypothetical protein